MDIPEYEYVYAHEHDDGSGSVCLWSYHDGQMTHSPYT